MTARFCIDCDHERTAGDEGRDLVSFTADTSGWVAEFAFRLAEDQDLNDLTELRAADGARWATWREPVIGWAMMERHYPDERGRIAHEREVEPVLLAEGGYPQPLSLYRMDHGPENTYCRIFRSPPAAQPAVSAA